MKLRLILGMLFSVGILAPACRFTEAWATPASSAYKSTTLYFGTFKEFEVFNHATKKDLPAGFDGKLWLSLQKTKGETDLYVQNNAWAPVSINGQIASTGWHTHPGHSLIIVTQGTITEYHADCRPIVHVAGETFVDPGEGEEHIIRNESPTEAASSVAIQLVPHDPAKANRRIDVPSPLHCSSIM